MHHIVVVRTLAVVTLAMVVSCGSGTRTSPEGVGEEPDAATVDADIVVEHIECVLESGKTEVAVKGIRYLDSDDTDYHAANWRVALEPDTELRWPSFSPASPKESAVLFDLDDPAIAVSGFLVSREGFGLSAAEEFLRAQVVLQVGIGSVVSSMTTRASGANIQSLDGYDTIVGSSLLLSTRAIDAAGLRALVVPALMGRPAADVDIPAADPGPADTNFVLVLQTLYRPVEDQTIYVGAITRAADYDYRARATSLHADDLANGSGLTRSKNGEARECEGDVLDEQAAADIIWVLDASGSTDDDRQRIADNAEAFFQLSRDRGLDFRMGVTDMDDASQGRFATRDVTDLNEHWIGPDDPAAFIAAVADPSGPGEGDYGDEHGLTQLQAAINGHLPRSGDDPLKIRPDAKLALIIETDEKPQEIKDANILPDGDAEPTVDQARAVDAFLVPYLDLLHAQDALVHLISVPLPYSQTVCSGEGEHTYGYYELPQATGGQMGSLCQVDLGGTLDSMLDTIVGDASPITLEFVPISASIAVTRDGVPLPRSRQLGWDYRGSSNSIVLYGIPIDPAHPAEIAVAYRRWYEQVID